MKSLRNAWWKVATTFLLVVGIAGTTPPAQARFVGADPVKPDEKSGENFNRYAYANNNPYRYTDPDGRFPFLVIPLAIGGGAALLGVSGDAHAPARGQQTSSMSFGDASGHFMDLVPAGRFGAVGRTILNAAPVYGNPQVTRSGGKETMHGPTSERRANERADQDGVDNVFMNSTLRTVTGGAIDSPLRPDVAVNRSNGTTDITEVLSPRQDAAATIKKYQDALGERAGRIECIQPDKC